MDPHSLLRHTVATVAYRGGKVLRGAPAAFGEFHASPETRSPSEILAHVCDLFDWALCLAQGKHEWHNSTPREWDRDVERFFAALEAFDACLAGSQPLGLTEERLFQGPIADALTHIGQIAMLRRLAGSPVKAENYFRAEIAAGRVGSEQAAPKVEFG
jgi:hypothetical protein